MSAAMERVTTALRERHARRVGQNSTCPAHDDSNPSLTITDAGDRVLLDCKAGCPTSDVIGALGLTLRDLYDDNREPADETVYLYRDEQGESLFEVVRFADKKFAQRLPGAKSWGIKGARRVLYHLPELRAACRQGQIVWVVEGERDADRLTSMGLPATTSPMGAGKWQDGYADMLDGAREVVIVCDRDEPGTNHARAVAASLERRGIPHRIVQAAVEARGADVSDHLDAGLAIEALVPLKDEGMTASESPFIDWSEFWSKDRTASDWLIDDVLARGRGHSIYASHKTGKSLLMLWAALALIRAGHVVLYFDFEMGEEDLAERLGDMGHGPETDLSRLRYALLPALPPLDTAEGAEAILGLVDEAKADHPDRDLAVVIDTLSRAVAGEENDADTIRDFYRHTGLGLKQRRVTWARLDHAGKDPAKGQRGTSAKGDDVDVIWRLAEVEGGLELRRDAARMGWVPQKVPLRKVEEPVLRFERVSPSWPTGTLECAADLDGLRVPLDASTRTAQAALRAAGKGRRREVMNAALRHRKMQAEMLGTIPGSTIGEGPPEPLREPPAADAHEPRGQAAGPLREPQGTRGDVQTGNQPRPYGGRGGPEHLVGSSRYADGQPAPFEADEEISAESGDQEDAS